MDEIKADGTSRHAREGGRCVCARCRSADLSLPKTAAPSVLPPRTKVWPARRAGPCAYARRRPRPAPASPPARPPSPRTPRSSLSPSALSVVALTPLPPPPLFRLCTGPRGEHPRGGATSPPHRSMPSHATHAPLAPPRARTRVIIYEQAAIITALAAKRPADAVVRCGGSPLPTCTVHGHGHGDPPHRTT